MIRSKANGLETSSFRDPSGFVFYEKGSIFRQVNAGYKEQYDLLINSGLYDSLATSNLLVPHDEVDLQYARSDKAYKVIQPEAILFVSYPYEWSFSQLKDAALTTLEVQKRALDFGMSLKDCSAYNIQFRNGKPVFIDTLSFETYQEGRPWVAYRQFCQHFFAPLVLMSYTDIRLSQLLKAFIDGIPLDLTSSLLPFFRSRCKLSLLSHIHIHAKSQKIFSAKTVDTKTARRQVSRLSFLGLIDSLETAVSRLTWKHGGTEWADYYDETNYSSAMFEKKQDIVSRFIDTARPQMVWDLGANVGLFSRIASDKGIHAISFDFDPACVEMNYQQCSKSNEANLLPLLLDLTNPSPAIGWKNQERLSLLERGPTDMVMALALIHHLAISNNVPLKMIADFFSRICNTLIIEFVPKEDSQVQRLLSTREDIFPNYDQVHFENSFKHYFSIEAKEAILDSKRVLYMMRLKTRDTH